MPLSKKYFIYYCCISVSEGLNTTLSHSQLTLEKYNKKIYQKCRFCCCVIEIKKTFREEEDICKLCLKLLEIQDMQDAINPKIYVLWKDNQKYRVCTNFYCSFADLIFKKENIKDKFGKISQETLSIYLNKP